MRKYYGIIATSILFFVPLIFTLGAKGVIFYIARTHARKRGVASFKKVRCQNQRRHFSKQSGQNPFLDIGVVPCYWLRSNQNKKTWPRVEVEQLFWWQPFAAIGRNKFSYKHYKERQQKKDEIKVVNEFPPSRHQKPLLMTSSSIQKCLWPGLIKTLLRTLDNNTKENYI